MNFSGVSRESTRGRLLRLPLKLLPRTLAVPVLQGALKGERWIVGAGTHGCWLGSYEFEKCRAFQSAISPGQTVYDVGAHAGYYTLLASRAVGTSGHVVALEPVPENVALLRRHLSLNRTTNVHLIEAAAADSDGTSSFELGSSSFTGSLTPQGALHVQTVRLDSLISSGTAPPPDCMKIDVEGAETQVLQGASRHSRRFPTYHLPGPPRLSTVT